MPFSRNGGRGPFWVCVIWPPVMWWWAFAYESFTSCTHLLLVLLLLLFFLVSSLVFASCAFNSLQPCRGVGEEGRVSKWHMVGSGFGGNTKLENTIPKSWHRTVDTWSGIQPLDTKLSLVSYFFQTVFELQECCVSTFYYQKSAFLNSIGYDKLLLDCCLIITIDLYSCVFLCWWNNCLQVENLDRKLLSSRTPDFVQYTKSFYKAGVGLNTEVGFVACSMHTWEAAFFGHFLGRGCDTFFQAEGGHLFLPGILFWSAWTVSFQALCPLCSAGQSSGGDWSWFCHLVGVLWLLRCQMEMRCRQSHNQLILEPNLLCIIWENPSCIELYRWFWQRLWVLAVGVGSGQHCHTWCTLVLANVRNFHIIG